MGEQIFRLTPISDCESSTPPAQDLLPGRASTSTSATGLNSITPAIAASGNKALIGYRDDAGGDIRVKLFDGVTGTVSSSSTVAGKLVASTGNLGNPDVAALTGGRYVVVWENFTNDDIEGRFVDANGNPIGAAFTIGNNAGSNQMPSVAGLPDGGFIVTWETNGGVIAPENGVDFAVLARRFNSTGAPAGDLFLVNVGNPNASQFGPAVAVNPGTGRAFMVWHDFHSFTGAGQDNEPPGIRGRAFLATTDVGNGTPGDDTITTYNLGETVNGLGGNDTINARGGNDVVNGGSAAISCAAASAMTRRRSRRRRHPERRGRKRPHQWRPRQRQPHRRPRRRPLRLQHRDQAERQQRRHDRRLLGGRRPHPPRQCDLHEAEDRGRARGQVLRSRQEGEKRQGRDRLQRRDRRPPLRQERPEERRGDPVRQARGQPRRRERSGLPGGVGANTRALTYRPSVSLTATASCLSEKGLGRKWKFSPSGRFFLKASSA